MRTFTRNQLFTFSKQIFESCGMINEDATQAAHVLTEADMRGVDSHGVARLSGYVGLWRQGRANMKPNLHIVHETLSTATLDADEGLGLVAAPYAMQLAITKAKNVGTGWIAIRNSNHFGIAAYHAMMALPHDMIGFAITNASPLVAPTNSRQRMLGTNPICYAIPAGNAQPVVIDLATSTAANGKLEIAQRAGKTVPLGWLQNKDGTDTNNPCALKDGGLLLPLGSGSTQSGHKGYALSALVDILSGVLSGANYGPWVPPFVAFLNPLPNLPGKGIGHMVGAMRIDAFQPKDTFYKNMQQWIEAFKQATPIDSNIPVLIPGQPEFETRSQRERSGIPLNQIVIEDLAGLAKDFKIENHPFR
jgi:L-2-hydroxycarboxylate dehydrogenase (NAD+)